MSTQKAIRSHPRKLNLYCYPLVWVHMQADLTADDLEYHQAKIVGSPYCERFTIPYAEVPLHRHHGHEMLVVTHGVCQFIINESESMVLTPGSVLVIPGGNAHRRLVSEKTCCCGIELSPDYFHDRLAWTAIHQDADERQAIDSLTTLHMPIHAVWKRYDGHRRREELPALIQGYGRRVMTVDTIDGRQVTEMHDTPLSAHLVRDQQAYRTLLNLCEECLTAYHQTTPLRAHLINAFGPLFALFLLNLALQTSSGASLPSTAQRMIEIKQWLDRHYSEEVAMTDLAEKANLSPHWFSDAFRKTVGISPKSYLISLRLEHAAHLLVETDYSITEIVQRIGYSDLSNFIRAFVKRYELSPQKYRQHYGQQAR